MTQILAINEQSREAIEKREKEIMEERFRHFMTIDPDVRELMLGRAKLLIESMSKWDLEYHGAFKEMTGELLASPEMRPLLVDAIKRVLESNDKEVNFRIVQAVGECLAGKISLKID